jgi:hypothetical protein
MNESQTTNKILQNSGSGVNNAMKKSGQNNLGNSRTNMQKDSRSKPNIGATNTVDDKITANTVIHLKSIINKEKKRVRDLKNLYMKEIGSKSEL